MSRLTCAAVAVNSPAAALIVALPLLCDVPPPPLRTNVAAATADGQLTARRRVRGLLGIRPQRPRWLGGGALRKPSRYVRSCRDEA